MIFNYERTVHFRIGDTVKEGAIKFSEPVKVDDSDSGFWVCYWTVSEIHPEIGKIYGIDKIDALCNCISFLSDLIRGHTPLGFNIWWLEDGDAGGFLSPFNSGNKNLPGS